MSFTWTSLRSRWKVEGRWLAFGVACLLVAGFTGLMAWGLLNKAPVTARSGANLLQRPAPNFTMPLLDQTELTLAQLAGKPVVLNFWASWCPPCRDEALALERVWRAFGDDVWIVGLDIQDGYEDALSHVREFDVTYPNGRDTDGNITVSYGVIGLPTTFLVGRDGVIEGRWVGAVTEAQLKSWVEALVTGRPLSGDEDGQNLDRFLRLDQGP